MQFSPIDEAGHRPPPRTAVDAHGDSATTPPAGGDSLAGGMGADHTAAPPASVPASFVNPVIRFDSSAGLAVLQFRDGETGEPQFHVPSQRAVMEYREQMAASRATVLAGSSGKSV